MDQQLGGRQEKVDGGQADHLFKYTKIFWEIFRLNIQIFGNGVGQADHLFGLEDMDLQDLISTFLEMVLGRRYFWGCCREVGVGKADHLFI